MKFIGLDLETTGKLAPAHRIIECCGQIWETGGAGTPPTLSESRVWRFNPQRSIDAKAYAVHHIALEDLAREPLIEQKIVEVLTFIFSADMVVYHNGDGFDWPFLRQEVERICPTLLPRFDQMPSFDTMTNARWATFLGKMPRLGELCYACNVPYDPEQAHAAEYDVDCMMRAFFYGLRANFFSI